MEYLALVLGGIAVCIEIAFGVLQALSYRVMQKRESKGTPCIYLCQQEDPKECVHILFKLRKNKCPRERCWGFDTGEQKEAALFTKPWLLAVKKVIDSFPAIAAVLLALNELLSK